MQKLTESLALESKRHLYQRLLDKENDDIVLKHSIVISFYK